jgi:hypothetical protein
MTNAPTAQRSRFLGLLPFIGVVLFVGAEIAVLVSAGTTNFLQATLVNAVLFLVGASALGNGVVHLFFAPSISRSIGWPSSPYQWEVGGANLAIGIAGVIAALFDSHYWLAVIIINLVFLLVVGVGHLREVRKAKSLSIGSAWPILVLDVILPIFCLVLWIAYTIGAAAAVAPVAPPA